MLITSGSLKVKPSTGSKTTSLTRHSIKNRTNGET